MKKKSFVLCLLLLVLSLSSCKKKEELKVELEEKEYWQGSIDDDFEDNCVIITLTKEASKNFREYSPKDFTGIECESVKDLTSAYKELIEKGEYHNDEFRRILSITLSRHDKNYVVECIRIIQEYDFVKSAEPNGYDYPENFNNL